MATVQTNMVLLSQMIDPFARDGTEITSTNVHSAAGKFTAQQRLDLYNRARIVMFGELRKSLPPDELSRQVNKTIENFNTLTFASGVSTNFPTDCLWPLNLRDAAGAQIFIVRPTLGQIIAAGNIPHFVQSSTNRHVTWEGLQLRNEIGITIIPDAATYRLKYYKIAAWTLTDVSTGTALETFNDDYQSTLLEIAVKLALEQGTQEVNAALSPMGAR